MLRQLTEKLLDGENLAAGEASAALRTVFEDDVPDVAVASFLTALRAKGETVEEIAGFADMMRAYAERIDTGLPNLLDTAGTGGGRSTFNISTTAAFVIAATGIPVAKHGNRAITSRSGSADMLEALGVRIDLPAERTAECIVKTGIGFMFAPLYHPAMKRVAVLRRQLGFRTVFNMLGPLTNPAGAPYQLIGVYAPELTERLGNALALLGCRRAWVVHGGDGIDELSICRPTQVSETHGGQVRNFELVRFRVRDEEEAFAALEGGTATENAKICTALLSGELRGPARDVVLANAAAAIHVASGETLDEALRSAERALDSGEALAKLSALKEFTNAG